MYLHTDCKKKGFLHEFMHAIGFVHEHNRMGRDNFIRINRENFLPEHLKDFEEYVTPELVDQFPYSGNTIVHFKTTAHSKNGKPTIEPLIDRSAVLGEGDDSLTTEDVYRINTLYQCPPQNWKATAYGGFTRDRCDFPGNDLREIKPCKLEDCSTACYTDEDCSHWVFIKNTFKL